MSDSLGNMFVALFCITVFLCFLMGGGLPIVWGCVAAYGCLYATKYVGDHVD